MDDDLIVPAPGRSTVADRGSVHPAPGSRAGVGRHVPARPTREGLIRRLLRSVHVDASVPEPTGLLGGLGRAAGRTRAAALGWWCSPTR